MSEILDEILNNPESIQILKNWNCVDEALTDAGKFSLQVDVVIASLIIMKNNPDWSIEEVVREAMVEWDIW